MAEKARDWSEKDLRKVIVEQRRHLWRPETITRIAETAGIRQGITMADAGCGLGYLGWTFREHFGETGTYLGLDCSEKLLLDAVQMASDWADGCAARFIRSSAESLPLKDRSVDAAICQTLLMHLADPESALAEMVRITRPGGAVICMEPDNVSSSLCVPHTSLPSFPLEERIFCFRVGMIWSEGRKRLGKGDWGIGTRLPLMMSEAGLVGIDSRPNDLAVFVQPPYETDAQKCRIEQLRDNLKEKDETEERRGWTEFRECFFAGGGSRYAYYKFRHLMEARKDKVEMEMQQQVEEGTYSHGQTPTGFYCVTGFVPE